MKKDKQDERRQPWMKFYGADWRSDLRLRSCSIGARGIWMEMLCLMHEADPRGSLVLNGKQITPKQLSAFAGVLLKETESLVRELEDADVFSRDDDGTIYSRRMRRDIEKAIRDRTNGSGGGNPFLKRRDNRGVNPLDKAIAAAGDNGQDKAHGTRTSATSDAREYPSQDRGSWGQEESRGLATNQGSALSPDGYAQPCEPLGWDDDAPFGRVLS